MSRIFEGGNGDTNHLAITATFDGGDSAKTYFAWIKLATATPVNDGGIICTFSPSTGDTRRQSVLYVNDDTGVNLACFVNGAPDSQLSAIVANELPVNVWIPVAFRWDGNTTSPNANVTVQQRQDQATNTGAVNTGQTGTTTLIGMWDRGNTWYRFHGKIAHPAIWDIELSNGQIDQLMRGVPPSKINPRPKGYWPLTTPDLSDDLGGNTLTMNGTVAYSSDNPPIRKYSRFALADPLPQTRVLAPRVRKWATRPPLGTPVRRGLGIRTLFVPDRATNSALEWFTNIRVAAPSGMIVQADDRYGVVMRNVDGAGTGFYILYTRQIEYFDDGWTDQVQISSIFRKSVHDGLGGQVLQAQGGNDDDFCTGFGILANELLVGNISSGASNPSNTLQASPNDLSLWHGIFASRVNGVGQKLRTHNVFDDPIDTTVTGPPNQFGVTQPLTLGGGSDDLYFPLVVISDREWSDAECVAFYNDPWNFVFEAPKLHVPIEYQELTFDEDAEERLFMIPQRARRGGA